MDDRAPGQQVISAKLMLTAGGLLADRQLLIDDGTITAIEPAVGTPTHEILAPGFVDLQVNGLGSVDIGDLGSDAWVLLSQELWSQGVTTWCPTLTTRALGDYESLLADVENLAGQPGPTVAGVHLEGPFLGTHHGAHKGVPHGDIDLTWLRDLPDLVKLVTLGPERSNAAEAIALLTGRGVVVSLGHTDASFEQTIESFDAGATMFTHCYNAAATMHHRRPGPVAAALTRDDVAVSIIADGVHVHPAMVALAWRAKPLGKLVLVTDAVASDDADSGDVYTPPRLEDGTLTGSHLTMDGAVHTCVQSCGLPLTDALTAASTAPARAIDLTDRGQLEVGGRADLVALTTGGEVAMTWQNGLIVWSPETT